MLDETPETMKVTAEYEYVVPGARVTARWLDPHDEHDANWRITAYLRVDALDRIRHPLAMRLSSHDVDKGHLSILCFEDNPDRLAGVLVAAVRAHTTAVAEADAPLIAVVDDVLAEQDKAIREHTDARVRANHAASGITTTRPPGFF